MQTKLTVRVEKQALEAAKRHAAVHNTTLSKLISEYLRTLAMVEESPLGATPVLKRLTGILPSNVTVAEHHQHLAEKYAA